MPGNLTPENNDKQGFKRKSLTSAQVATKIMKKRIDSDNENEHHPALLTFSKSEPGTSKNMNLETGVKKFEESSPDLAISDFDADNSLFIAGLSMKLPYKYEEDEMITSYVLKGKNIFKVSSISLWKYLEAKKKNPKRTYQSLKNRFLRNIKPHLFTTYKHLINNIETAEKILLKFPELGIEKETKKFLSELSKKGTKEVQSNSESMCMDEVEKVEPTSPESVDPPPSSPSGVHQTTNSLRTIEFGKNLIKITIDLNISIDEEVSKSSFVGLSERFKKYRKNTERIPCPTCGRFYRRPVSNDSGSDGESDVLIPNSIETGKNSDSQNLDSVSSKTMEFECVTKKLTMADQKEGKTLLISLEKSDKSEEHSEDSNNFPEEVSEKFEVKEIISIDEMPLENGKTEPEDKDTETDSDIDLIYEHTVARFNKLIDADEEKTLERKCLNKNRSSIGFNPNTEKNLDSFFLETPMEVETPALTNDFPTQVEENKSIKTQSQRVTRSSSALASNMMKMLVRKTYSRKLHK